MTSLKRTKPESPTPTMCETAAQDGQIIVNGNFYTVTMGANEITNTHVRRSRWN